MVIAPDFLTFFSTSSKLEVFPLSLPSQCPNKGGRDSV